MQIDLVLDINRTDSGLPQAHICPQTNNPEHVKGAKRWTLGPCMDKEAASSPALTIILNLRGAHNVIVCYTW